MLIFKQNFKKKADGHDLGIDSFHSVFVEWTKNNN
jgi:hypothetical protein